LLEKGSEIYRPFDPQEPITSTDVKAAAESLSLSEAEVWRRYEALATEYGLKLEFDESSSLRL
jgi:hypothetical protein